MHYDIIFDSEFKVFDYEIWIEFFSISTWVLKLFWEQQVKRDQSINIWIQNFNQLEFANMSA